MPEKLNDMYSEIEDNMLLRDESARFYHIDMHEQLKEKNPRTHDEQIEFARIEKIMAENAVYIKAKIDKQKFNEFSKQIEHLTTERAKLFTQKKLDESRIDNLLKQQDVYKKLLHVTAKRKDLSPQEIENKMKQVKNNLNETVLKLAQLESSKNRKGKELELITLQIADIASDLSAIIVSGNKLDAALPILDHQKSRVADTKVMIDNFIKLNISQDFHRVVNLLLQSDEYKMAFSAIAHFKQKSGDARSETEIIETLKENPERLNQYYFHYRSQIAALYSENITFKMLVDKQMINPKSLSQEEHQEIMQYEKMLQARAAKRTMVFELTYETIAWEKDPKKRSQIAENYVRGIDFAKYDEIRIEKIEKDKIFMQYQAQQSQWQGSFYSKKEDRIQPHHLGIGSLAGADVKRAFISNDVHKKQFEYITTQETFAIVSRAGSFTDDWSLGEGAGVKVKGGGMQYYAPERDAFTKTLGLEEQLKALYEEKSTLEGSDSRMKDIDDKIHKLESLHKIRRTFAGVTIANWFVKHGGLEQFKNKLKDAPLRKADEVVQPTDNVNLSSSPNNINDSKYAESVEEEKSEQNNHAEDDHPHGLGMRQRGG